MATNNLDDLLNPNKKKNPSGLEGKVGLEQSPHDGVYDSAKIRQASLFYQQMAMKEMEKLYTAGISQDEKKKAMENALKYFHASLELAGKYNGEKNPDGKYQDGNTDVKKQSDVKKPTAQNKSYEIRKARYESPAEKYSGQKNPDGDKVKHLFLYLLLGALIGSYIGAIPVK